MKGATLAIGGALAVFVAVGACAELAPTLNPDPVHGGACHNGDQLATLCGRPDASWCCPDDTVCGMASGECETNVYSPGQIPTFRRGDAGRDSGR